MGLMAGPLYFLNCKIRVCEAQRNNEVPSGDFKRQNGLATARWRGLAPTSSVLGFHRSRSFLGCTKNLYGLQITRTVCTAYGNLKYKRYNVLIFFDLPYRCVQVQTVQVVRTSSVKKCTFYGQGWTSGSMPTKPRTLRPPGR